MYISRRALKHFVESRSREMKEKFTDDDVLKRLYFAIDSAESIFQEYDIFTQEDEVKRIYAKYFDKYPNFLIRIVVEVIENHLEVKSIHFKKTKKPPD